MTGASMIPPHWARRGAPGFSMVELIVAVAIFAIIAIASGSLYVSTHRSLDAASAEAYLQRTGTLIEEDLRAHVTRARLLQVAHCRPTASATIPAGKSIMYTRLVQDTVTGAMADEVWCVYEYQAPAAPYPSLWRCRIAGISPPQDCTTTPENLVTMTPKAVRNTQIRVSDTSFAVSPITCGSPPVACAVTTSVDVRFSLDVRDPGNGQALMWAPRMFGFNTTIRN